MAQEPLAKSYEPAEVEKRWYAFWEQEGMFHADPASDKPPYSIVIPPPNVTGQLHMGHALNNTMQDILCRYKRMTGYEVLWMPGTDHAGIATQNVVERQLASEGKTRHDLGREAFIERVWEWRAEYGGKIINQLKRLGASCDWERERFTMDEGLSKAVREVFVRLYEEGLIYRGDYIINWCPRCHTALSDLESEHEEVKGGLYHIRYPFKNANGYLVVATTRPETLLGDTAVAVNPEDPRYADLPDDTVLLPLLGRELPIIRDSYVSTEFGTGALKITPAHDPNDFMIGQKHDLAAIRVMDDNGTINQEGGPYAGLDRFEARKVMLEDLEAQGLLEKQEDYMHSVGHCYRCKTMVEPILSKQWFVKVGPLAEQALKAVQDGRTKIVPAQWEKTYYEWMTNIRDWCVSRQIWWGHRIPAWYCECGEVIVSRETPGKCPACGGGELRQETDVLDTWFSSALWPFSTMGWPEVTPELAKFYPTSCLVTGFDILFFWVARMMMTGIKFMDDVPFTDVYIHALVRDASGQKMSKSKGNVIDPLIVMDQFGTDAFRFTLAAFAAQGRDIKMSEERIAGYRNFVNKIWNAARFTLMNLDGQAKGELPRELGLEDRWILSRVSRVAQEVGAAIEDYRFNEAAGAVYQFVWHEFCDWYLELAKGPLHDEGDPARQEASKAVLAEVFSRLLRLLHPFMPFVSEELWHRLPGAEGSIMTAPWPACDHEDPEAEAHMGLVMGVIGAVRNIRGEMGIRPGATVPVVLTAHDPAAKQVLSAQAGRIQSLAKTGDMAWADEGEAPAKAAGAALPEVTVYVPLEGLVDFAAELARLDKELAKLQKEITPSRKKLANEGFLKKAPEEVVEKERGKVAEAEDKIERLNQNLERIRGFVNQ
ncbi:MAG: valine--tRNA ligase [Desulfarculaceae bacterium]|nr:valine--tRNA ligase [Desulfarculaceae bacterium]MCF8071446.1 valine--tRNA ligase [Desulfarculaceae bacterium]MCF8103426.1 valine--tRNA ligase [Desulfarculaceae bacterium]MCF8117833.1 valine--tRNA ligase [Desulfarculaceae bacterium]